MSRKKRKRETAMRDDVELPRRPRWAKRLLRRFGLLLLLLVGLVAAAPTIVSRTSLRDTLIAGQLPSGWSIASEQATLGWMSSQTLTSVTLTDAEGKPMLTVESLKLSKPLLSLAMNQTDLGKVEIVRPVAILETRPNGSNWEDLLLALQQQDGEQQEHPLSIQIEIVDGVIHGVDQVTGKKWLLDSANLMTALGETMQVNGSAQLAIEQPAQRGQVKFRWQPGEDGGQQAEILAERLPLGPLEPWLARVVPGAQLAGALSTDAQLHWRVDPQRGLILQSSGRLESRQLDFSADMLAGDRLRWRQMTAPWKLSVAGDELTIEQLTVDSDWAKLDVTGSLTSAELQTLSLDALPKNAVQLSGRADLAKLATMLPRTLQLREGVRIDAGQLEFAASGQPDGERFAWQGTASLQNLAGTDGQRQIRWQEPVELAVRLRETSLGPQLEQLTLNAPFAKANLQTKEKTIEGKFELDLAQLSQELSQFVDLESWQLRGLGEGTFTLTRQANQPLTRQANQQFSATANVDLTDLHVAEAGRIVWTEPKLQIELNATGAEQDLTPRAITTGKIELRGPRDHFEAELLEPVDLNAAQQSWLVQVDGNGPLALWAGRLRPWVAAVPERVEGDAHLRAKLRVAGDAVHVIESEGSVVQLRVEGKALAIDEPRVEFAGDARWDRQTGSLQTQEMQLLGSSFSFRARDIAIALASHGAPTARGSVAFRADLERLAAMAGLVGQPTATWPRGTAVGQLQLASSAEQLQADFGVKVEQLELARTTVANGAVYGQPEIVWTEPQLEVTGVAKYVVANDRFQFDNLQVHGQTLQLNSSASIDRVSTDGLLQASGLVEYAPEELTKLVASYAGLGMQVQGDRQVRFQISGPLFASAKNVSTAHWSHRWNATAEAGWSSAGAYGLLLGGGRLQGKLSEGQLQVAPLDIAVGQGRFTASPLVRLTPGAEQLVLPKGPLVTNVDISPEVSETMLKYVAPILAGATRTEGQFSIDLDLAEVPFGQPEQARVQGRLTAHRLSVSPGPMTSQLVTLVSQIEALTKRKQFLQTAASPRNKSFLTMTERQVDFQVVEGRVYHRNLEFLIDDVPVRSRGSVGFDQTLAIEIEIPIQDKWIEREPALRGFAGKSLKIPIYGTFQKPRIDERAVADLSRQLLQGAATQAIGDELNRQFEKLFQ